MSKTCRSTKLFSHFAFSDTKTHNIFQMRSLYQNRTELKVDLIRLLGIMDSMCCKAADARTSIECLEERVPLVEGEFELIMDFPDTLLSLAVCYTNFGRTAKIKEMFRKAYKSSMCVNVDHFKALNPGMDRVPGFEEFMKNL
jgi:hypothetical protein